MLDCENDVVGEKDPIIIKRGTCHYVHYMSSQYFHFNHYKVDMSTVIGKPYLSTFRIKITDHEMVCCLEECKPQDIVDENQPYYYENDQLITDENSFQSLSKDAADLKNKGMSSNEIIKKWIKDSGRVQTTTAHSQKMNKIRKRVRGVDYILVLRPSIRLLSNVFYRQVDANHSFDIRPDTLARILTAVNFHPNGKYIVFERDLKGLIGASMINRLSPKGMIINVMPDMISLFRNSVSASVMRFSREIMARVVDVPLKMFNNRLSKNSLIAMDEGEKNAEKTLCLSSSLEHDIAMLKSSLQGKNLDSGASSSSLLDDNLGNSVVTIPPTSLLENELTCIARKEITSVTKNYHAEEACNKQLTLTQLQEKKADGIIIACKRYQQEVLELLIPYLSISRTFAVYGAFREPLAKLFETLGRRNDIVNIHLTEGWLREYQIVQGRTRPLARMSSKSGYLLWGMVVDPQKD